MDTKEMQKMFEQLNNTETMGKMMQSPEMKNLLGNPDFMNLAHKMFDDDEDKEVINSMINTNKKKNVDNNNGNVDINDNNGNVDINDNNGNVDINDNNSNVQDMNDNNNNNVQDMNDNNNVDINDNNNKYDNDVILLLTNLKNESFNNRRVKVVEYSKEKERYEVELLDESFDSKHILVKESNLEREVVDTEMNKLEEVN